IDDDDRLPGDGAGDERSEDGGWRAQSANDVHLSAQRAPRIAKRGAADKSAARLFTTDNTDITDPNPITSQVRIRDIRAIRGDFLSWSSKPAGPGHALTCNARTLAGWSRARCRDDGRGARGGLFRSVAGALSDPCGAARVCGRPPTHLTRTGAHRAVPQCDAARRPLSAHRRRACRHALSGCRRAQAVDRLSPAHGRTDRGRALDRAPLAARSVAAVRAQDAATGAPRPAQLQRPERPARGATPGARYDRALAARAALRPFATLRLTRSRPSPRWRCSSAWRVSAWRFPAACRRRSSASSS